MQNLTVGDLKKYIDEQEQLGNIKDSTLVVVEPIGTPTCDLSGVCMMDYDGLLALAVQLEGDIF